MREGAAHIGEACVGETSTYETVERRWPDSDEPPDRDPLALRLRHVGRCLSPVLLPSPSRLALRALSSCGPSCPNVPEHLYACLRIIRDHASTRRDTVFLSDNTAAIPSVLAHSAFPRLMAGQA